jgi:hypothetical protein
LVCFGGPDGDQWYHETVYLIIENYGDRESYPAMQRMTSNLQPAQPGPSRVQTIVITAITLFAISGLMVGFAVGAVMRPPQSNANANDGLAQVSPTAQVTQTTKTTPTATQAPTQDIDLGCPAIPTAPSGTAAPDNVTDYEMSVQATDKTNYDPNGNKSCQYANGKPAGNNVTIDGLTCKIWVSSSTSGSTYQDHIRSLSTTAALSQPFPDELQNALMFDGSTPQMQTCNKGTAQWKFKLSSAVLQAGNTYNIIAFTYYNQRYNFNWAVITVPKYPLVGQSLPPNSMPLTFLQFPLFSAKSRSWLGSRLLHHLPSYNK